MAAIDLARSHVERCLQDLWSVERVLSDADGDYCYGSGSAACYIGLDSAEPVVVKAVACAAGEVKKTAKLLNELNEVNARCPCLLDQRHGAGRADPFAETVDRRSLAHAGQSVAHLGNDLGPMIAAVCGGRALLEGDTAPDDHRVEEVLGAGGATTARPAPPLLPPATWWLQPVTTRRSPVLCW